MIHVPVFDEKVSAGTFVTDLKGVHVLEKVVDLQLKTHERVDVDLNVSGDVLEKENNKLSENLDFIIHLINIPALPEKLNVVDNFPVENFIVNDVSFFNFSKINNIEICEV